LLGAGVVLIEMGEKEKENSQIQEKNLPTLHSVEI